MMLSTEWKIENNLTIRYYFRSLTMMLGSPGRFFFDLSNRIGLRRPLAFLIISSMIYTGASLIYIQGRIVPATVAILFINAICMPFISAVVAFMVMLMLMGKQVSFERVFAICAFSSGTVLLASWIPVVGLITELWKWILITLGMIKACGIGLLKSLLIAGITIAILMGGFWSAAQMVAYLKGAF